MSLWIDQLQQASFRGKPFAVERDSGRFGRRIGLHEYPFRDKPWAEDIGRATRAFTVEGFLVENSAIYGGGSVISQLNEMIGASETKGVGVLIHPVLGQLKVVCLEFSYEEVGDEGRKYGITFNLIEIGERTFPSAGSSTKDASSVASSALTLQSAAAFVSKVQGYLTAGAAVINRIESVASDFAGSITGLIQDATGLLISVSTLPGEFGRFFGGHLFGFGGVSPQAANPNATIASLQASSAASREAVSQQTTALTASAAAGDLSGSAAAVQGAIAALAAAIPEPKEAIRILAGLLSFSESAVQGNYSLSNAMQASQDAFVALVRRTALAYIGAAVSDYQPWSSDDAFAIRNIVAAYLDAEMIIAADAGDDSSYKAIRQLRIAIVQDLNARGASLPPIKQFNIETTLPSLVLGQRLYRDSTRSDELVFEGQPIHPSFMPTKFKALSQ